MNLYIFDIDGTITKDAGSYQEVFLKSCNDLNVFPKNTNWSSYKHHTDRYIFRVNFEKEFNRSISDLDIDNFERCLIKNLDLSEIEEMLGAKEILTELDFRNIPYVFATGSMYKAAMMKMQHLEIKKDEIIVGSNNYDSREDLVEAAIELGKKKYSINKFDRIISIGDGLWDLKTAQKLGLDFVGIGNKHKSILLENGCLDWIEDFKNFNFK